MWRIGELLFIGIIIVLMCTEVFYPLIANVPFFPSFRKSKPKEKKTDEATLESKLDDAKTKVNQVKEVQEEVKKEFRKAKNLKNEADNLLK